MWVNIGNGLEPILTWYLRHAPQCNFTENEYDISKNNHIWIIIFSNTTLWTTSTHLSYIINAMAADDLAVQETKTSAAMILTYLAWNRNKFQWHLNHDINTSFFSRNAFENVFCKMAVILFRSQCVNALEITSWNQFLHHANTLLLTCG